MDGQSTIRATFRFTPAPATIPFSTDLGTPQSRHEWTLVAGDCQVEGRVEIDGPQANAVEFVGRGYHDHNAGSEEIRLAMKTWGWGRVHIDSETFVYYFSDSHRGPRAELVLKLVDGQPQLNEKWIVHEPWLSRRLTMFGLWVPLRVGVVPMSAALTGGAPASGAPIAVNMGKPVDAGPFYLRWVATFTFHGNAYLGITEWLATKNLHRRWFNWMIPYRLKRPKRSEL